MQKGPTGTGDGSKRPHIPPLDLSGAGGSAGSNSAASASGGSRRTLGSQSWSEGSTSESDLSARIAKLTGESPKDSWPRKDMSLFEIFQESKGGGTGLQIVAIDYLAQFAFNPANKWTERNEALSQIVKYIINKDVHGISDNTAGYALITMKALAAELDGSGEKGELVQESAIDNFETLNSSYREPGLRKYFESLKGQFKGAIKQKTKQSLIVPLFSLYTHLTLGSNLKEEIWQFINELANSRKWKPLLIAAFEAMPEKGFDSREQNLLDHLKFGD